MSVNCELFSRYNRAAQGIILNHVPVTGEIWIEGSVSVLRLLTVLQRHSQSNRNKQVLLQKAWAIVPLDRNVMQAIGKPEALTQENDAVLNRVFRR